MLREAESRATATLWRRQASEGGRETVTAGGQSENTHLLWTHTNKNTGHMKAVQSTDKLSSFTHTGVHTYPDLRLQLQTYVWPPSAAAGTSHGSKGVKNTFIKLFHPIERIKVLLSCKLVLLLILPLLL